MIRRLAILLVLIVAVSLAVGAPVGALADGGREPTQLKLTTPESASLGETVSVESVLTTSDGTPIMGAVIQFSSPFSWGSWGVIEDEHGDGGGGDENAGTGSQDHVDVAAVNAQGEPGHGDTEDGGAEIALGSATTDANGVATIPFEVRRHGDMEFTARFEGTERYEPSSSGSVLAITGNTQLYTPTAGIRVPLMGIWFLGAILAAVWGSYLTVGLIVFGIAAPPHENALATTAGETDVAAGGLSRRDFLQRTAVPLGMLAFAGSMGSSILTIVARSPNTHNNLKGAEQLTGFDRTPFATVGLEGGMKPMPPILEREVSFTREVLPIFQERAGPHAVPPKNSPAPGGVRLDSYEHIMAREGLVVPGNPEESELVGVLRSEVMYMPPIRTVPLSQEQVQIIASWIAQGARKT